MLRPLNRGEKNRKTLFGTAQRWSRSLNRGGRSIEVLFSTSFLQLFPGHTGRLIENGCLIGGHLMDVQLYTEWDDNHVCIINQ